MQQIRVLKVLSSYGKANGGHYYSLKNVADGLNREEHLSVDVLTIGNSESPVLRDHPNYLGNIFFRWFSFWSINKDLRKVVNSRKIDVIHCYDGGALLLLMLLPATRGLKLLYTKCGGPNERSYFTQFAESIILFSKENSNFYNSVKRLSSSKIYLIPNRVNTNLALKQESDLEGLSYDPSTFTMLRIARIGKAYIKSIYQSIELLKLVSDLEDGKSKRLIVIGTIENEALFEDLKSYVVSNKLLVTIYTDTKYAANASRFLYLADAVVGTGRGIMEAMAQGIMCFSPVVGKDLPVPVTAETVGELQDLNFSPRAVLSPQNEINVSAFVSQFIADTNFRVKQQKWVKAYANNNFIISQAVIDKYKDIYREAKPNSPVKMFFKNIIPLAYYLNVYRRVEKRIPNKL